MDKNFIENEGKEMLDYNPNIDYLKRQGVGTRDFKKMVPRDFTKTIHRKGSALGDGYDNRDKDKVM